MHPLLSLFLFFLLLQVLFFSGAHPKSKLPRRKKNEREGVNLLVSNFPQGLTHPSEPAGGMVEIREVAMATALPLCHLHVFDGKGGGNAFHSAIRFFSHLVL